MSNILQAENFTVSQLEEIFKEAGWSDGWQLTDEEVRNAPSPLFYRNSTPSVAAESKITLEGQTHSLYCIYNVSDPHSDYADNQPHHFAVTMALTFYFDDAFVFHENSPFNKFLSALLEELAKRLWVISSDGESKASSLSEEEAYANRKLLFATNIII